MGVNAFGDRGDQTYSQQTGTGAQGYSGSSYSSFSGSSNLLGGGSLGSVGQTSYGNTNLLGSAGTPGPITASAGSSPGSPLGVERDTNLGSSAGMFLGYDANNIVGNPAPRAPTVNSPLPESGPTVTQGSISAGNAGAPGAGLFPGLFSGAAISNPNMIESAVNEALNFGAPSGDSLGGLGKIIGLTPVVGPLMTIGGIMGDAGGTVDRAHADPEAYAGTQTPDVIGGGEISIPDTQPTPLRRPHRDTSLDSPLQFPLGQSSVSGSTPGGGQLARFGQAYGTGGGYL